MSVNIVYNPNKGDILSRFMTCLAQETGWTISKAPDPKADINYWGLYISIAQSPNSIKGLKGKVAACFSHYETETPKKAQWWETAASLVDIRTTWASQYLDLLKPYGESHLVIPPIDPQFKPQKPVIGISGYIHPNGRKGESLFAQLVKEQSHRYSFSASGKGWAVPKDKIKEREWGEMPDFYRGLDVYLVTSLTEGIPMPPLEALVYGKPVVLPIGVGIVDDLPLSQTIFRYVAGNYTSMLEALEAALEPYNQAQAIAAQFSPKAWAESHLKAFGLDKGITVYDFGEFKAKEAIREVPKPESQYSAKIVHSGAIVVAYGANARECALTCLQSWKETNPDYPIALVSDFPLGIEDVFIEHPDTDIGARSVKTKLYDLAPQEWEKVLYLDADTEIVGDVSVLFQWLEDGYDFLICTNPAQYTSLESGKRPDNGDETAYTIEALGTGDIIQMNGGVFAFRRGAEAKQLMALWHEEWQRYGKRDQMALLRALHMTPIQWLLLGNEWNTITRYLDPKQSAGILHHPMTARRWTGIIEGRLDSKEAWERVE